MCPYFGSRGARPPLGILPCAGAPSALSFLAEGGFKTRLDVAGRIEMTLLRSPALRRRLICAFVNFNDSMASPLDRCTKRVAGPPHSSFRTARPWSNLEPFSFAKLIMALLKAALAYPVMQGVENSQNLRFIPP